MVVLLRRALFAHLIVSSSSALLHHQLQPAILYNLRHRHANSQPYTRTGAICVAVNPYNWIPGLYTDAVRDSYSQQLVWSTTNATNDKNAQHQLAPHVYEVSALAYKGLLRASLAEASATSTEDAPDMMMITDQSILVSGESGAGKTETVKICLQHLARVQLGPNGAAKGGIESSSSPIVQRILDSNPLLEAFGNAKTVRNDNSSRFGKYLQLQFLSTPDDPCPRMVGSECEVYLLEKSRVVSHNHDAEERTYHILYQLLAAPEETKRDIWKGLANTTYESFKYVGYTAEENASIEGVSDRDRFTETIRALEMVHVKEEKLQGLLQALCVVLQLGNLEFTSNSNDEEERSHISSIAEFAKLASLMGISEVRGFEKAFTERRFEARGEILTVTMSEEKAKDNCDAFAKEIYARSFLWLVQQINAATSYKSSPQQQQTRHRIGTIGLLDIFGFETFESNGFEQLCINYANEMIQQKFTQDVFTSVLHEYEFEGIAMHDVRYEDNTNVLDLIEGRSGLLAMLNEECNRPNGNDSTFVRKAILTNKESACFISERMFGKTQFGIIHYAGSVIYDAEGFVYKNSDHIPLDLLEIAKQSTNEIISKHMAPDTPRNRSAAKSKGGRSKNSAVNGLTVWSKFKTQLNSLMGKLVETETRYIRCIKPNNTKSPLIMENQPTVEQLRCAGVVAAVTISRSAFPNRLEHAVVLSKFKSLWPADLERCNEGPQEERSRADADALLTILLKDFEVKEGKTKVTKGFVCGRTRSYFRAGTLEHLEKLRLDGIHFWVADIQRLVRGFIQRRVYQRQRESTIKIQSIVRQHACKIAFRRQIQHVVTLQTWCRCLQAKRYIETLRMFTFATRIQAKWKANHLRTQFVKKRKASVQVQRIMRGKLARLRYPTIRQQHEEQLKVADQIKRMREKLAEDENKKKAELMELKRLEMQREQEARMQKLRDERQMMEQQLKEVEMEKELEQLRVQLEEQKMAALRPVAPQPLRQVVSEQLPVPKAARMTRAISQPQSGTTGASEVLTAEQKRLMEESGKIIELLRKENVRLKKKAEQQRKDFATLKENNQRLMEANSSAGSSFQSLNQHARQLSSTNQKLLKNVAQYRNRVTQLHANIKNRQKYVKDLQAAYKMETEARGFYEQTLLAIVDTVSEYDCDTKIQELVLAKAVECAQMSQRVAGRAAPDLEEEADLSVSADGEQESD